MADNYLITGYWGEPHVTAENDRGIHAGIFGKGRHVLPVGKEFKAEYIGNNTIRMYDGKLVDNGAAAGIPAGEYVDFLIANAGQGLNRIDYIVFQYSQDASTLIERGEFVVVQGVATSGVPQAPAIQENDLLSGEAAIDQMLLYQVNVSGSTINAPTKKFVPITNMNSMALTLSTHETRLSSMNSALNIIGTDYIVAQNITNTSGYRKWNSGLLECWGTAYVAPVDSQANNSTALNGVFASGASSALTYPVAFTYNPLVFASPDTSGSVTGGVIEGWLSLCTAGTKTTSPTYRFVGVKDAYYASNLINIMAIGRWK